MSERTDRPQVRTAQDLERKYAWLFGNQTAIKQTEVGLVKVNGILNEFLAATIGDLQTLQAQLDGQIDTWYGDYVPTLSNEPTSSWNVSDYDDHIGDLFYDRLTGDTYQFEEDNGTYSWVEVQSSLMSEILSMANAAKDTADGKRRVFVTPYTIDGTTYSTPQPPYDIGDLWVDNAGNISGVLYICQIARESGSYVSGDFIVATKYTDDTVALSAKDIAEEAKEIGLEVDTKNGALTLKFDDHFILNDGSLEPIQKSKIKFDNGSINLSASSSGIQLYMDNDSIEFRKSNGDVLGSWSASNDTATSTELNLGNFAFIPRDNGSLGFRKVK